MKPWEKAMKFLSTHTAVLLAVPAMLSACLETTQTNSAGAVVSQLSDGGVEVTLQGGANCVTRWNSEAAMTYATEGVDRCTDREIATAKRVAISNIANL
jgi:hypothetical protein